LSTYQGLYQFNPTSGKFNHYKGLPQNITSAVALGSKLFLVSGRKLYTYDKSNRELIKIPNREIGLQFLKKIEIFRDQRILLYGRTGFSVVDADELTIKNGNVDLRWTNFSISNTEINPHTEYNSRYVLTKNIDETDEIELQYNENSFRIEFSALPYNSYRDIEYRYILENYEENWNTLRNGENYVSYTQTRPGKYLLKVQASDDQGRFKGEERVLSLIVQPPLYMSKWALILYLLCFVLLILFYRRILLNRERDRNELLVEKLEHQKSEELIALKTRFFTNITHELKTPLTLISSPIDDLLTKPLDEKTQKSLTLVKRNADRLKKLVNQILDIRKIEAGGEKLRIQNYDIVKFCNQIKNQFKDESLKRNIFLQFSSEHASKMMWFDIEKVEKILFNLLSNAFKFTPDKGTIRVSVDEGSNEEQDSDYIFISVSDTGKGISKEDQANIFDRFNSLSSSNYTNQKGTGIGLSLIYEYTALHGGVVKFDSVLGVGSKFVFTLPKDKSFLNNYEVIETTLEEEPNKEMVEFEKLVSLDENRSETEKEEDVIVKVLIVEDDPDMRDFLISGFSSEYSVVEAEDGKEGLKKAIKELPDIIVSDLMMPNLDGIAFCKKLKADFRTSHIPFILLTAKGDMESKLIGLETGADDYIQKPFNLEHLMVRVKGLISQRESLRKKYLQQVKLEPGEITVNSLDEKFLDELLAKIESEMDNSDLSVKLLSEMLGISPANLYRKIKALTGETATEFIRNIRLKRAAQLLKNKHLNVSEVMYMVGFTHHSYFARSFKELFGVSPKSYGS
jgi:signal transduction histidine kinase/DNA-binding response OmpR family regulator